MVGFEKTFGAVKVIKDQIQYMSQSLLNLARDYFSKLAMSLFDSKIEPILTYGSIMWGIENCNNSVIIKDLRENSGSNRTGRRHLPQGL